MLCAIIRKESRWIWNTLRLARAHRSKIGEESITDFLVLELKKASKGAYYIDSFTRPREKVTGADWELWFTGASTKWLGLRVQAKVIALDADRYAQLYYKRKDGTYQIDQLVADAKKHSAIPLYCLYSYWRSGEAGKFHWACRAVIRSARLFGAGIVPVSGVRALKAQNEDALKRVVKYLSPLHCLFCCQAYAQGDLPSRSHGFLVANGFVDDDSQTLLDEPPYYVRAILQGEREMDLADVHDENLRMITVIREGGERQSSLFVL